ncbi:MAG: aminoglycoside phosphotransferase family protein [Pyrinomonadaceae bacterium]
MKATKLTGEVLGRIQDHAREWGVVVEGTFETESSAIAFGKRDNLSVVLKVIKKEGDEWLSGEVLEAFKGNGVARVYECVPGAVLLERLQPGHSLADMSLNGNDERATEILCSVIRQMSAKEIPRASPTVHDWGKGFERYVATGDDSIPNTLVQAAQRVFSARCASQGAPRLLHGDLQHYNVLFDLNRGWLAIDPKGLVGEIEYEVGALLRNPIERPELFLSQAIIERRVQQLSAKLKLDSNRALAWGFAQAVLSAIWEIEDGFVVDSGSPALRLANVIQAMMGLGVY